MSVRPSIRYTCVHLGIVPFLARDDGVEAVEHRPRREPWRRRVRVRLPAGHADIRTTMGYTHLTRDDLRALVDPSAALALAGSKAAER